MQPAGNAPKRRLGVFTPVKPPLDAARDEVRSMDEAQARARFELEPGVRLLKTTVSLCPTCLGHVPAVVFERSGRVLAKKRCPSHGVAEALLENDARFYFLSNKDRSGRVFSTDRVFDIPDFTAELGLEGCCEGGTCDTTDATNATNAPDATDQMTNKSCTVLVEVTDACNLACPVCYSDAKGDRKLPFDAFCRYLETLVEKKGGLDSVQLTGGEAMLHPEFWAMLDFVAHNPRIKKVYLPTNGILLLKEGVAERLVPYAKKLMVLLQFDGTSESTDERLRGATPGRVRKSVVERLGELGIFMQLTMTLTLGVNEHEVGDVIELALTHTHVKVVALQPATYSGRYELDAPATERLTLSDLVKAVAEQARRRAKESDFVPIPCSHPNCGWITLFLRRFGLVGNVVRYVDLPKIIDNVAYRTLLSTEELRSAVGTSTGDTIRRAVGHLARGLVRSEDIFTIAIKPFMDRHNYDQDRVDNCCHHLLDTKGNPRSFCEYNALLRQKDGWSELPPL